MLDKAQRRMTPEEFYAWQEAMDEKYELVDGYPVERCPDTKMMTGARRRHDQIVWNFLAELKVQLRGKPCRGFTSDTAVKTATGRRRPDAGVECGELDDESFLERLRLGNREQRSLLDAPDVLHNRQIAVRSSRKNTTAGREDHVRLVRERLDDDLSANSLRFADQPDDRVFGL